MSSIEFMGSANCWFPDHNPTNNEICDAPGSAPVMFNDYLINTVEKRIFWCADATPGAQKWNEIQMTSYV